MAPLISAFASSWGLFRIRQFGRTAVVERITSRAAGDAGWVQPAWLGCLALGTSPGSAGGLVGPVREELLPLLRSEAPPGVGAAPPPPRGWVDIPQQDGAVLEGRGEGAPGCIKGHHRRAWGAGQCGAGLLAGADI